MMRADEIAVKSHARLAKILVKVCVDCLDGLAREIPATHARLIGDNEQLVSRVLQPLQGGGSAGNQHDALEVPEVTGILHVRAVPVEKDSAVADASAHRQWSLPNPSLVAKEKRGFKEIVLTGTHIGQYRDATEGGLWALLEKITGISGDYRIRLSSLDPRDLSGGLIRLAATHPRVCDHLHVSVQSLSQKVLDRMNRSATDSGSIVELLAKARADFPRMGIGADFIAGFPGETEAQFEETVDNVRKIGFSYGHVFRYSRRPFTPAASFPDHLDEKEKTRRSARLRAVIDECRSDFIRGCEGSVQRIIAETEEPVTGYSSNYLRLEARGALCKRNDWCAAVVDAYDPGIGRCIASVAR